MPDAVPSYTVLIIGSGFGGMAAAVSLARNGIDFLILERRAFMGGTWMQNTYPGAAVDVQSPLYSLSFERYDWSRLFAKRDELAEYTEHVIQKYGLRHHTRTQSTVTALRWDADQHHWCAELEDGTELAGQFVINASGPLSTPVIPPFKGKETFKGASFHTNNWDHDVDLTGKRVAVVGSGASAAQVIPAIVDQVGELHVFQRTPHWVAPRHEKVFSRAERAVLRTRLGYKALRTSIYWQLETRVIAFKYSDKLLEVVGEREARKHLEQQVADPELRAQLTPDYQLGCKRVILSNDLYPALCRDKTTLWTRDRGIAEITPTGIVTTTGETLDVDVIVYATGYDATDGAISYPVTGSSGTTLQDFWADFPRAYLGTVMPDFPNLFIITGPNTGIGHTSALFIIEAQLRYVMSAIEAVRTAGKRSIEVRAEAEAAYTERIHKEMERTVWHRGGCNSWYKSKSGKVIAMFPGFSFTFRRLTRTMKPEDHIVR